MTTSVGQTIVATAAALWLPCAAAAEQAPPPRKWSILEESLGMSFNRLGLQNQLGWRWGRSLGQSPRLLFADAHLAGGVEHTLTPSYTRLGAWVEVAPLSIFAVRAGAEPGLYFGTFGSLMSFASYDEDFSDAARSARSADAHSGSALRLYVSPTLRMRVRSYGFQVGATLERWSSNTGPFFYEPSRDTLLRASGDRLLLVSAVLVHERRTQGRGLRYGLSYDLTDVLDAPANRSQKVGIVVARQLAGRPLGLPSPSLGARVGYYLDDATRKGQLTAAVGCSFERGR
jgi:hypothetical protein